MSEEHIGAEILKQLLETGPLRGWEWVREETLLEPWATKRQLTVAVDGERVIEGTTVTLRIGLSKRFPKEIPFIYLVPPSALGRLPHVENDGFICYVSEEGLVINHRDPDWLIRGALDEAVKVLEDGVRGDNHADFINDLEYYWNRFKGRDIVSSFVNPGSKPKRIIMTKDGDGRFSIADSHSDLNEYQNEDQDNKRTHYRAIYLPLRPDGSFPVPEPDRFWTLEEARRAILDNVVPDSRKFLKKVKQKGKWKPVETIVLGVSRPAGGTVMVGIRFMGVTKGHPLSEYSRVEDLVPLVFLRLDREYLLPRGGADLDLTNKRVALVGCGSVGGYIAYSLVKAGIQHLTLIDGDDLEPENIFRHVLGRHGLLKKKSDMLKYELDFKFPYMQVKSIPEKIYEVIESGKFRWSDYDLVVVAIGVPPVEIHLNEVAVKSADAPPVLFAWLEPYDIGGHVIMVNNGDSLGCLECLFTPSTPQCPALGNKVHFSVPGQHFGKDLTGCGNLFTPFGSLSALRTAEMASRMAIETLSNHIEGNPLVSWKGNARAFLEAGFELSKNYQLSHDELLNPRYDYAVNHCPNCGSGAGEEGTS